MKKKMRSNQTDVIKKRGKKDAYAVPSREMRCIVAELAADDGERPQEDEGDADADCGDLVSLETCSLGLGLGGGLECQDACGRTRDDSETGADGEKSGRSHRT